MTTPAEGLTPQEVGALLRTQREEKIKISQAEMARRCERTQPTVQAWESGESSPRTRELRRVAAAYRLKPDQLIPRA